MALSAESPHADLARAALVGIRGLSVESPIRVAPEPYLGRVPGAGHRLRATAQAHPFIGRIPSRSTSCAPHVSVISSAESPRRATRRLVFVAIRKGVDRAAIHTTLDITAKDNDPLTGPTDLYVRERLIRRRAGLLELTKDELCRATYRGSRPPTYPFFEAFSSATSSTVSSGRTIGLASRSASCWTSLSGIDVANLKTHWPPLRVSVPIRRPRSTICRRSGIGWRLSCALFLSSLRSAHQHVDLRNGILYRTVLVG